MSKAALADLFDSLHLELTRDLLRRIKSGEATASELNVARQMLKDNGIDAFPKNDPHLAALAAAATHIDEEDVASGWKSTPH